MTGVDRLPQFEESLSIVQNNQQSTNPPRNQRARKNLLSTCKIRCDQDLINSAARSSSYLVDLSQQEERKSFGFEACDRTALLSGLLRIGISIRSTYLQSIIRRIIRRVIRRINAFVQSRHVLESPRFVRRYLEPTWLVHDAVGRCLLSQLLYRFCL